MTKCLSGIVCANITPFDKNGHVDFDSLKRLAIYLADSGINALYPSGTNGEGLSLTIDERKKITRILVETIGTKIPVVIQCGTQTLDDTKALVQDAKDAGAAAAGIITPFFFKLSQDAMIEYYTNIYESFKGFPIYIYNIPSHTNNDILPDTVEILANRFENFAGIKYSHPDINRLAEYINIRPEGIDALIGCDRLIYPAAKMGAVGTVTGPAAMFPELFSNLWQAIIEKNDASALKIQKEISKNDKQMAKYQSIPLIKLYLKKIGVIDETVCRIPFHEVSHNEEVEAFSLIQKLRSRSSHSGG